MPADLGAGWFEGLSQRNRYALLARQMLWEQLADYVASLDEDHFRRSLVFLRRAFGGFSAREKRQIAENLAEHWGAARRRRQRGDREAADRDGREDAEGPERVQLRRL